MSAIAKIKSYNEAFTQGDHLIATYILNNPQEVSEISIQAFAQKLDLSTATISRFAKKIGFASHAQLKLDLIMDIAYSNLANSEHTEPVSWSDPPGLISSGLVQAIANTLNDVLQINSDQNIQKAVDLIASADSVYCAGLGSSMLAARELVLRLLRINKKSLFLEDSNYNMQNLALATPRDVLVIVSYSGNTKHAKTALSLARSMGMRVISITRYAPNNLSDSVDVNLCCPSVANSDARLCSIIRKYSQILLVDFLFIGVARKLASDPEDIIENYMEQWFFTENH